MNFDFMSNKKVQIGTLIVSGILVIGGVAIYANEGGNIVNNNSSEASIKDNKVIKNSETTKAEEVDKLLDEETESVFNTVKENEDDLVILCNKDVMLGENYIPDDLVVPKVPLVYPAEYQQSHLRDDAGVALEKMFADADKVEGLETMYLVSGYRSYDYQYEIFNNSMKNRGKEHTEKYMAKPGHSEHQTGLTADISTKSMGFGLEESFEDTEEGKWLAANAHKYGFILRYPEERVETTGYAYEPWHFRFVGEEVSKYMHKKELVLEDIYESLEENNDSVG